MKLIATSIAEAKRELLELKNKSIALPDKEKIKELLNAIDDYENIISEIQELHCKETALNIIEELSDINDFFMECEVLSKIISTSIRHVEQLLPNLSTCGRSELDKRIKVLEQHAPQCTKCSNKLIVRQGNGTYFWGCPDFPDCWGKRWLTKEEEAWIYYGIKEEDNVEVEDPDIANIKYSTSGSGREVIEMLAKGINPLTGEVLPENSFINNHTVVRALHEAVQSMNTEVSSDEDLSLYENDKKLFESLRKWRWELCQEKNVPAFMIIENKPLIRVSKVKPNTMEELKEIKGFGDVRVSEYGEDIINIVKRFSEKK